MSQFSYTQSQISWIFFLFVFHSSSTNNNLKKQTKLLKEHLRTKQWENFFLLFASQNTPEVPQGLDELLMWGQTCVENGLLAWES